MEFGLIPGLKPPWFGIRAPMPGPAAIPVGGPPIRGPPIPMPLAPLPGPLPPAPTIFGIIPEFIGTPGPIPGPIPGTGPRTGPIPGGPPVILRKHSCKKSLNIKIITAANIQQEHNLNVSIYKNTIPSMLEYTNSQPHFSQSTSLFNV